MGKRRDKVQARPQAVGDLPFVGFAPTPVACRKAGSDAYTRRDQVLRVDGQCTIARCRRLPNAFISPKECRTTRPGVGILRIECSLLVNVRERRPLLAGADRGAAIPPDALAI